MLATFWIGVCIAAWLIQPRPVGRGTVAAVFALMFILRFATIPTAIGTLFGRTVLGGVLGFGGSIAVLACLFAYMLITGGD